MDFGNRKFILVSNSESNICRNVAYKRLLISAKENNESFEFLYGISNAR